MIVVRRRACRSLPRAVCAKRASFEIIRKNADVGDAAREQYLAARVDSTGHHVFLFVSAKPFLAITFSPARFC